MTTTPNMVAVLQAGYTARRAADAAEQAYLEAWDAYERLDAEAQADHESKSLEEIEAGGLAASAARDEAMRLRQVWHDAETVPLVAEVTDGP